MFILVFSAAILVTLAVLSVRYTEWRPIFFVVMILAFFVGIWVLPQMLLRNVKFQSVKERIELTNEIRKTLGQFLAGLLVLTGLYFTWRTVESTYSSLRLAQESQITDRYFRALQHLSSPRQEARLGAIFTLDRIMLEAPDEAWPILQVLVAYLREQSRSTARDSAFEPPRPDTQAVLEILRNHNEKIRGVIDLSNSDLRMTDLSNLKLVGVRFDRTMLDGATLVASDFSGGSMISASFEGAYFSSSESMRDSNQSELRKSVKALFFWYASPARLRNARLIDANLRRTALRKVDLKSAILICADLRGADLSEADLSNADLTYADLRGAKMEGIIGLKESMLENTRTDEFPNRPRSCPHVIK